MSDTWHLFAGGAGGAAWNMAVDEALLEAAAARGRTLLRVYGWDRPAISIGYFQKYPAHLAGTHAIVRRPTGGGLVDHGEDTTLTVIAPPGHRLAALRTAEAYCEIHQAVAAALELAGCTRVADLAPAAIPAEARSSSSDTGSAAVDQAAGAEAPVANAQVGSAEKVAHPSGLRGGGSRAESQAGSLRHQGLPAAQARELASRRYECFQNPVPGDVVAAGRKLAGGAQRRTKLGMLHQGSIAGRLTAQQLADGFQRTLGISFAPYHLTAADCARAEKLVRDKYATDAWNKRVI